MKKVFKVNLGMVMALFAAFGLMSFKMASKSAPDWYNVEWDAIAMKYRVGDTPLGSPGENCSTEAPDPQIPCAVEYDPASSGQAEFLDDLTGEPHEIAYETDDL